MSNHTLVITVNLMKDNKKFNIQLLQYRANNQDPIAVPVSTPSRLEE